MPIDQQAVDEFLNVVESEIIDFIRAGSKRFPDQERLIRRYVDIETAWHTSAKENIRPIYEIVNELTIAVQLLKGDECARVQYEPPIHGTKKTIDFLVSTTDDRNLFFDVKTIHPEQGDAWDRFQHLQQYFTPGTILILNKDWLGGEIAHDFITARQRFLDYTLEYETKIEAIDNREIYQFAMVFCGSGTKWRESHLEDFADFYRTGRYRSDDHFGEIQKHYMKENGVAFAGMIDSFCYLERQIASVMPKKFRCNLRGWPPHR